MNLPLPEVNEALQRLAIALCLGLFIGLEREHSQGEHDTQIAVGLRTLGLTGLLGAVSVYLALLLGPLVLMGAWLALGALAVAAYWGNLTLRRQVANGAAEPASLAPARGLGVTSEVAAMLAFGLGGLAMAGQVVPASVFAVVTTIVLWAKKPLHAFVRGMGREDMLATLTFAVVTVIVLPILPRRGYGPYAALNPFTIWLMVTLISGISFLGYALTKLIGPRRGLAISSLVGGLASSTAVTIGWSRQSRSEPEMASQLGRGVLIACAVMAPRVAVLVGAISPEVLRLSLPALATLLLASLAAIAWRGRHLGERQPDPTSAAAAGARTNPLALGPALVFALGFAVISLLVAWAQAHGATLGIYVISLLSGFTDVDALVLSLSQRAAQRGLNPLVAAQGVVLALVVNTVFKAGLTRFAGNRELGRSAGLPLLAVAAAGLLVAAVTIR